MGRRNAVPFIYLPKIIDLHKKRKSYRLKFKFPKLVK